VIIVGFQSVYPPESLATSTQPSKPFKPITATGRCLKEALGRKVSVRMSLRWVSIATVVIAMTSGCQCCPVFDRYANVIDDVNDTHVYFDRWYNPKFDITRMGKPDWCSPFNNYFCKRCCNNGCYDRYDDCNLYPPLHPYELPSYVMPPPTYRTTRVPKPTDPDSVPSNARSNIQPVPAPAPASDQ